MNVRFDWACYLFFLFVFLGSVTCFVFLPFFVAYPIWSGGWKFWRCEGKVASFEKEPKWTIWESIAEDVEYGNLLYIPPKPEDEDGEERYWCPPGEMRCMFVTLTEHGNALTMLRDASVMLFPFCCCCFAGRGTRWFCAFLGVLFICNHVRKKECINKT